MSVISEFLWSMPEAHMTDTLCPCFSHNFKPKYINVEGVVQLCMQFEIPFSFLQWGKNSHHVVVNSYIMCVWLFFSNICQWSFCLLSSWVQVFFFFFEKKRYLEWIIFFFYTSFSQKTSSSLFFSKKKIWPFLHEKTIKMLYIYFHSPVSLVLDMCM